MKNQEIKALLLDVAETFRKIAMELGEETEEVKEVKEEKKEAKDEKEAVKLEDVRKICAEKSSQGLSEKIKEIIESYGVSKLSEIDSKYYAEIIERVSKL